MPTVKEICEGTAQEQEQGEKHLSYNFRRKVWRRFAEFLNMKFKNFLNEKQFKKKCKDTGFVEIRTLTVQFCMQFFDENLFIYMNPDQLNKIVLEVLTMNYIHLWNKNCPFINEMREQVICNQSYTRNFDVRKNDTKVHQDQFFSSEAASFIFFKCAGQEMKNYIRMNEKMRDREFELICNQLENLKQKALESLTRAMNDRSGISDSRLAQILFSLL